MKSLLKAIIILPGTVAVLVPAFLIWFSRTSINKNIFADNYYLTALSAVFFVIGFLLTMSTVSLFVTVGRGTPAPWDPPKKLVVEGPYRYVRNPMISGVMFILTGEALIFGSWLIFGWMVLFFVVNSFYFRLSEEKTLAERFGDEYLEYKKHVPRWFPRFTPWNR